MSDKEIWKDVLEYEGYYQVSSFGRVRSLSNINNKNQGILKGTNAKGYIRVALQKEEKTNYLFVHRLVAQALIPNTENKPFINHKDGDKANNEVDNLEWCTRKENGKHASENGLYKVGQEHGRSKLSNEDVLYIYDCIKDKVPLEILACKYKVHYDVIVSIKLGKTWKFLNLRPIKNSKCIRTTLEEIIKVESMLAQGILQKEIHKETKISKNVIININKGLYEKFKKRMRELS